jgi:hypothetical protein
MAGMGIEVPTEIGLSKLPWPQGGGKGRYGYTPGVSGYVAGGLDRSLDAKGFGAVAAAWRSVDHAAVIRAWRDDCGKWNLWVNGHQAIYDAFVHEPTARLLDGLEAGRRCAAALGLSASVALPDAEAFVAAWHHVANHEVVDPHAFGLLLTDPPDAWAVGLAVGSLLIADGDPMPSPFEPFLRTIERPIGR